MVIGDDVTRLVPPESRSGLSGPFALALQRLGGRVAGDHLDHRRGIALEQLDARAFEIREIAAGLHRARGRRGKQQTVDIGLRDVDPQHDHKRDDDNSAHAVAHCTSPRAFEGTIEQA